MRIVILSFKRLYDKERLTAEQIKERLDNGTITEEEYAYIIGETREAGE